MPLKGASAVAPSRVGILLVEDDLGIYRLRGTTATLWAGPALDPALGDLEGLTANDEGDVVWAVSEETGTLVEMRIGSRGPRVVRTGVLARPGARKNKGYEGIAWLAPRHSPTGRAAFVAVHEHKPRRVVVCDARSLAVVESLELPTNAKRVLDDLADVAVDPVTGLLVVLSEESRRLAVMRLTRGALELVSTFDVPVDGGERPEGVAFLTPSRLVVVTEGPARLLTLSVRRDRAAPV